MLTSEEVDEIRARITAGEEPWSSAWSVFLQRYADADLGKAPDVDPGPFTGGADVHSAFLKLDEDSRAARNLAIAYVLSGDIRYAQTAHDILVAWSRAVSPDHARGLRQPGHRPAAELGRVLLRLRLRPHQGQRALHE